MTSRPALISFVLPALDEAANVAPMADRLIEVCAGLGTLEIIFVDDGSTDGTLGALRELAKRNRAVRYIAFTRNFGHQAALRAGLKHATGDAVVILDCDFEHPPEIV